MSDFRRAAPLGWEAKAADWVSVATGRESEASGLESADLGNGAVAAPW